MERERLSSKLGFILLSAGCAIGCVNVWKFPWMAGSNGGGLFFIFYAIFLILLGVPVLSMELAVGRAAQLSPIKMYQKLEKPGQKWHIHGYFCLIGNILLMAFYTTVIGWIIYYFIEFLRGNQTTLSFDKLISNPKLNVILLFISISLCFIILTNKLKSGLEAFTNFMMISLFLFLIILAIKSLTLKGASEGLSFFLIPDFSKFNISVIVAAMNQAFFTLSVGLGSMSIFGSYIDKEKSLLGESIKIMILDSVVAVLAGIIIFSSCFTFNIQVNSGPSLLFNSMTSVFNNMIGGRIWGSIFFLTMIFAAFTTELTVCENILACIRELTGWSRKKGSIICGLFLFALSLTTALGFSVLYFHPFGKNTTWLDFWDFIVSNNLLPLGALVYTLFCTTNLGFGWDAFITEVNTGNGIKIKKWMKYIYKYFVPLCIVFIYISNLISFKWK